MAAHLSIVVFLLSVTLVPVVSDSCQSYTNQFGRFKYADICVGIEFCCGFCENRYCCTNDFLELTKTEQDNCPIKENTDSTTIYSFIGSGIFILGVIVTCCVCPCCCLYKTCRQPRPVIATTTTQVISTSYPQQPAPGGQAQAYQGAQYPGYHPVPVQPGYGGQPTAPATYQGQPYQAGPQPRPPPPYHEAVGAGYPPGPGMSYCQAAFAPGQPGYPSQPQPGYPSQPQPGYPSEPQPGYPSQPEPQPPTQPAYNPAYNPAYAEPPSKTGY